MLTITTLGWLSILRDDKPVTDLASRKTDALLLHVACSQRPQSHDVLAEVFWEERSQHRRRHWQYRPSDRRFGVFKYTGHIGYRVDRAYRGRRYAARGCKLIFQLVRRHGMKQVWITCGPENVASRRTYEIAGGVFEGIADVPEDHPAYARGEFLKCHYRFDLFRLE